MNKKIRLAIGIFCVFVAGFCAAMALLGVEVLLATILSVAYAIVGVLCLCMVYVNYDAPADYDEKAID